MTYQQKLWFTLFLAFVFGSLVMATCISCISYAPPVRSPVLQQNAGVKIRVKCPDGNYVGSGVIVGRDRLLTAEHVVSCSNKNLPSQILVDPGDGVPRNAVIEVLVPNADIARLLVDADLSEYNSPIVIGPRPQIGDTVCEVAGMPRWTYRCFTAQVWTRLTGEEADIYMDGMMVEFGNSGSGLYDAEGRLVGIVVRVARCQDSLPCSGRATSLQTRSWLIPSM